MWPGVWMVVREVGIVISLALDELVGWEGWEEGEGGKAGW